MGQGIKRIIEAIDEAVFPSNIYCICCGSLIDSSRPYALCDECVKKFHWITGRTCSKCGKALPDTFRGELCYDCMSRQHYFYKGYSCMTYGLHEREVLMDYKYSGKGYLGKKFGDILYDRISCENVRVDVIIPVPVSSARLRKRGYNQSAVMAEHLAKRMKADFDDKSLVRVKKTQPLRSLNPAERELALENAFSVVGADNRGRKVLSESGKSGDRNRSRSKIMGKSVLLIDDIYTTGATADACSKALLEAGAEKVILLSLASGGNRKPELEIEN